MDATSVLVRPAQQLARSNQPAEIHKLQRLLQLIVISPSHEKLSALRSILDTATDGEVIAQCIKILGDPDDLPKVRAYAAHHDWLVRLQAARALGRIGSIHDVPMLLKLLGDPEWSVRHRSAEAIVRLLHKDQNRLSELLATVTDPFARDMLTMSMVEQGAK